MTVKSSIDSRFPASSAADFTDDFGAASVTGIVAGICGFLVAGAAWWNWQSPSVGGELIYSIVALTLMSFTTGVLATVATVAFRQRRLATSMIDALNAKGHVSQWAIDARDRCPFDDYANPAGDLLKTRLYTIVIQEWELRLNHRMQPWYFLVAISAVTPAVGYFLRLSPERVLNTSSLLLVVPAATGMIQATLALAIVSGTAYMWTRVFFEWKQWATEEDLPKESLFLEIDDEESSEKNVENEIEPPPRNLKDIRLTRAVSASADTRHRPAQQQSPSQIPSEQFVGEAVRPRDEHPVARQDDNPIAPAPLPERPTSANSQSTPSADSHAVSAPASASGNDGRYDDYGD